VEHPPEMSHLSLQSPSCLVSFKKIYFDDFCGDNDYLFEIVFLFLESFYISKCVVSTFLHYSSFGSIRNISQDVLNNMKHIICEL
jgi:hypothetical protein